MKKLTKHEQLLLHACQWHQRNDRNGEFMNMWEEYTQGEAELETVHEVCTDVFYSMYHEDLTASDVEDRAEINFLYKRLTQNELKEEK